MVDSIDLNILECLKLNSRQTYVEIGKQVQLSQSSVRERVKKMEDIGIIKKYGIELQHKNLGLGIEVFILFKLFSGKLKLFSDQLNLFPEIQDIYRITGPQNVIMKVILKDQLRLQQFIDRLIAFGEPTTHLILTKLDLPSKMVNELNDTCE